MTSPPPKRLLELTGPDSPGSLAQPSMDLELDRWTNGLPERAEILRSLPDRLNRDAVRAFCDRQSRDADGVVATFLASQVWGHGKNRVGPHRVEQALSSADAVPALQCAADELDAGDPVAAFEALCVVFKLPKLGMSFGTKYLFFADRNHHALILDRLIRNWLANNAAIKIPDGRRPDSYARWLNLARDWAQEVGVTPEEVELLIFNDEVGDNSQWKHAS